MGADAQISSPFSEIKFTTPSSCCIFGGENTCLDQGTVLLHGDEDKAVENIIPLCAPVESPEATEPTKWLPEVSNPLSRRFPFSLVSPVVAGNFPFARKFVRIEIKRLISKFHLRSAV